jgi:hypothetical protein
MIVVLLNFEHIIKMLKKYKSSKLSVKSGDLGGENGQFRHNKASNA